MKILVLSHSSVIRTYREKLNLIARKKNTVLSLFLPHLWPEAGKRVLSQNQNYKLEGFSITSIPVKFAGKVKRHFYPRLFPFIQSEKPDIIHIEEEPYSFVAWQTLRAAQKLNSAFIFFTWENLLENFPFPHNFIRKQVLKKADYAIAGDTEAAQLLKKAGYPPEKISVIPQYGVNPQLFKKKNVSPLKKNLKLGSFTVGYVGRLVPEKGIQTLLEAFAALPIPSATLLLVGNGALREPLEKKAVQIGVADRIRWVPAVDQPRIPDYLNCMDVLVLPSLTTPMWKEQFGRVLIEAQACEVAVVGSDSGAIPEVIASAGLVFPEGNVKALTQSLKKLAQSKALLTRLRKQGRQQVLKLYTNQKLADQIHAIYQKILIEKARL